MMIGVAQVIGMKPTLRSFFSGAPPCANASVAVLSGKNCEIAASAVEAPTDFRNARRAASLRKHRPHHGGGDDALVALARFACATGSQRSDSAACSCSAAERCWPQTQPERVSSRSASKGSSKVDMLRPFVTPAKTEVPLRRVRQINCIAARYFAGRRQTCTFYAALPVKRAAVGSPSSIGSEGSRDHSFQEPKYIRTSFTPAFFSARKVFEARAPLKQ